MANDIREVYEPTRTAPPEIASRIDKYRVLEEIGEGGMSVVYRARDDSLQCDVAVKVMHRHLARDPEARTRFSREARAVARLTHRNIPEIFDFSASDGDLNYIVSELVDGRPLSAVLGTRPALLPELGAMLVVGVARALVHAHEHKIIHRDVKPENVLVGRDGVVKLTDFGIAQIIGLESMTMTGTLIGSPAHMAPEQIDGTRDLDYRVDVWALGTVLYMAVTGGQLPFAADNPHSVLKRISEGSYADPRRVNPHVDSELAGIIAACLQVDRRARYETMAAVLADLVRWLEARGLHDPEVEIRGFMADPAGYRRMLEGRLILTLMALGDEAVAERQPHRALEHFGRVLTLDPDHPDAYDRVRRLTTGLRSRRLARRLALVAAAGLLGTGLTWAGLELTGTPASTVQPRPIVVEARAPTFQTPDVPAPDLTPPEARVAEPVEARVEEPAPVNAVQAGLSVGAALPSAADRAFALLEEAHRPRVVRVRPIRPAAPPEQVPTPLAVTLSVSPPAVRIQLDGQPFPGGSTRTLLPGTYTVTLDHPACEKYACVADVRRLVVEENAEMALRQHYEFTYRYPSATLEIRCATGKYARDREGNTYECGKRHTIPVTSHERSTLWLTVYDDQDQRVGAERGVVVYPRTPMTL